MKFNEIEYSGKLCSKIKKYYASYADEIGYQEFSDQYLKAQLENKLAKYVFEEVTSFSSQTNKIKILDIGSGLGGTIAEFRRNGIDCFGVEPDRIAIKITKDRLFEEKLGDPGVLCQGVGESLPFHSKSFDLVCSITVIEHVKNLEEYLREAYRVLKPDGEIFIIAPNYFSFWEGHYRLYTPPYIMYLSKGFFKLYSKLFARNPKYTNRLNFKINPVYLKKLFRETDFKNIKDISLNRMKKLFNYPEELVDNTMREKIEKIRSNLFLRFIIKTVINIIGVTKVYHPIVLIAQKLEE